MISFAGQRSEIAKKIIDTITNREWGFMLLDEVSMISLCAAGGRRGTSGSVNVELVDFISATAILLPSVEISTLAAATAGTAAAQYLAVELRASVLTIH